MDFSFRLPVNIEFGSGKIELIGKLTADMGKRVFLVTGKSSTKKTGLLDKTVSLLKSENCNVTVFDKVTQNPLISTVYEGTAYAKEMNCNVILGLGGGSVMDAAKAISFCCCNDGDITDYMYGRAVGISALPIILVPTTCGTGSEGNYFSVLTNEKTGDKKSLASPLIYPKVSVVDPQLMKTMPSKVLSSVGFDAFAHSFESYTGRRSNPITDILALKAMKLIINNLPLLLKEHDNNDAWESMTLASTLGGIAIGSAGVNAAHGLEHPVSGLKNIVHGQGLAALTPVITKYMYRSNPTKFAAVSKLLGGKNESECSDFIVSFLKTINLNVSLSDLGIEASDIDWMTESCLKTSAASLANAPVELKKEDIKKIYFEALAIK